MLTPTHAAKGYLRGEGRAPPISVEPTTKRNIRVCVRKRPMLEHEAVRGEFDCATVYPAGPCVTVHNCTMHANMKDRDEG